jgi:hypothetical protein
MPCSVLPRIILSEPQALDTFIPATAFDRTRDGMHQRASVTATDTIYQADFLTVLLRRRRGAAAFLALGSINAFTDTLRKAPIVLLSTSR